MQLTFSNPQGIPVFVSVPGPVACPMSGNIQTPNINLTVGAGGVVSGARSGDLSLTYVGATRADKSCQQIDHVEAFGFHGAAGTATNRYSLGSRNFAATCNVAAASASFPGYTPVTDSEVTTACVANTQATLTRPVEVYVSGPGGFTHTITATAGVHVSCPPRPAASPRPTH
jgi:hypothetical protein